MIWAENPLFSETSMFLSFSSINSVNACLQIHWSVGNALALFTRAVHCSGEINWASGLKNLCNNSNKHLGGETSKSFFFWIWNSPLEKKKLWGRFIIYISNEFESIYFSSWWVGWRKPATTATRNQVFVENQRQLFGIKLKTRGELDTSDALIRQRTWERSSCGGAVELMDL